MPRPKKKPAPVKAPPIAAVAGKLPPKRQGRKKTAQDRVDQMAAYARLLFAGQMIDTEAWRTVYDPHRKASAGNARTNANRIKRHPQVQADLQRLKAEHAAQLAKEEEDRARAKAEAEQAAIATRDEVLKFHTRVMRTPSNQLSAEHADMILVVETKRLAPIKYDDETGEPIPNPEADEDGYVTDVTRRPPDIKERQKSAEALSTMQGWNKGDPNLKTASDALTDLLLQIRGGGKV
jgi:hypothetical protein